MHRMLIQRRRPVLTVQTHTDNKIQSKFNADRNVLRFYKPDDDSTKEC